MRAIKTILIILGALVGLLLILGLMGSKTYHYERSATIAAPADAVFPYVGTLAGMDKWSPWNDLDPAMKKSIEGTDGATGAVAKWEGNKDVGKGEQRIDSVMPGKGIRTHLTFLEPWQQESEAGIDLATAGDSTKVTWFLEGENGFMARVMGVFMDMDAMIGKDFEKGLGRLRSMVEEENAKKLAEQKALLARYAIGTANRPAMTYVGVRETVKWDDFKAFFTRAFQGTGAAMGKARVKPIGPPTAVYFKWDEENHQAELLAGFPIADGDKGKVKDVVEYTSLASEAYSIDYRGGYMSMEPAHMALSTKIEMDGKELNETVIEEYITDPGNEPDSTKWQTNIIWLAKPKG